MRCLILLMVLFSQPALAHDWYPKECCHDQDCKPISCAVLTEMIDKGQIPRSIIKPSQDQACHLCQRPYASNPYMCAFVPTNVATIPNH